MMRAAGPQLTIVTTPRGDDSDRSTSNAMSGRFVRTAAIGVTGSRHVLSGSSDGATDECGFNVLDNRVHADDLHATLQDVWGIDHEQLRHGVQGRRPKEASGTFVHDLLA